jgi:hypothetical protein
MPRRDYSRIDEIEKIKATRELTVEEKRELKELKWCRYEREYKAKEENRNKPRQCSDCNETVPFYQLQNHKLKFHQNASYCSVCGIEVKFYKKHCDSQKHRNNLLTRSLKNPICINDTKTKVLQTSSKDQGTQETEEKTNRGTNKSPTRSEGPEKAEESATLETN